MPTTCVEKYHCGTRYPVWLMEGTPSTSDGIVNRTACATGYLCSFCNNRTRLCCVDVLQVQVKNCGQKIEEPYQYLDYVVYRLVRPSACAVGYCFGSQKKCENGTWSSTGYEPGCSNLTAKIDNKPSVSVMTGSSPQPPHKQEIQFHCDVDYDETDKDMIISGSWYLDGVKVDDFTLNNGNRRAILHEYKWVSIKTFGYTVKCSILGRFKTGKPTSILHSNEYFAGIKVLTQSPIILKENEEQDIELQLTVPFLPPDNNVELNVEIRSHDVTQLGNCPAGHENPAMVTQNTCGVKINATTVLAGGYPKLDSEKYRIKIKASIDGTINSGGHRQAIVKLGTPDDVYEHPAWGSYIIPDIEVVTQDRDRDITNGNMCYSLNDPHIRTLDGHIYENHLQGEFILYKHKSLPFEVHAFYKPCPGYANFVTCNCAVAVHSATDVIVIDVCDKGKVITRQGAQSIRKPFRLKMDGCDSESLARGTRIVSSNSGRNYKVYLPTGGRVEADVSGAWMNIRIFPSVLDYNNTEGLCGNFNGDCMDDLTLKSGVMAKNVTHDECETSRGSILYRHHNDFSKEWRVPANRSFYNGTFDRSRNLIPFLGHKYCACNGTTVTCEALNYVQMCESSNVQQSVDITQRHVDRCRNRRSTTFLDDIDDEEIYSFEYNESYVPPVINWPTASGWTLQAARDFCEDFILNASIAKLCGKVENVEFNDKIGGCIEDIKLAGDVSWALTALEAMKAQCLSQVEKVESYWIPSSNVTANVTSANNGTANATLSPMPSQQSILDFQLSTLFDEMCPNECSKNGSCVKGKCVCNEGYTSADCSISSQEAPEVYSVPLGGLCDVRTRPCQVTRVMGDNFIESDNLTCHIEETEVQVSNISQVSNGTIVKAKADFVTIGEVLCPLPTTRRKRSTGPCPSIHAEAYRIAISNNGNLTSDKLFLVRFNSACAVCNASGSCKKKEDACVIDCKCYASGERNPSDWCMYCNVTVDTESWTRDSTSYACNPTTARSAEQPTNDQTSMSQPSTDPNSLIYSNTTIDKIITISHTMIPDYGPTGKTTSSVENTSNEERPNSLIDSNTTIDKIITTSHTMIPNYGPTGKTTSSVENTSNEERPLQTNALPHDRSTDYWSSTTDNSLAAGKDKQNSQNLDTSMIVVATVVPTIVIVIVVVVVVCKCLHAIGKKNHTIDPYSRCETQDYDYEMSAKNSEPIDLGYEGQGHANKEERFSKFN